MKPLRFFVPPEPWFSLVKEIADHDSARVIFQRFETPQHPPGYHVASLDTLQQTYREGEFRKILFSLGEVPSHDQDWDFMSRSAPNILESTGGNWQEDRLGIRTLRIFAKQTRVKPLFTKFKRALAKICEKGMQSDNANGADLLYLPKSGWRYMSIPEDDAAENEYRPT